MLTNVLHGSNYSDPAVRHLVHLLEQSPVNLGQAATGYPVMAVHDRRPWSPDVLLVSPQGQVTIFDLASGRQAGNHVERQDLGANLIMSKLRMDPRARRGRHLIVDVSTITFGPDLATTCPEDPETPTVRESLLLDKVAELQQRQAQHHPDAGLDDEKVMSILCNYRHNWGEPE